MLPTLLAAALLLLPACGGHGGAGTTATQPSRPLAATAEELRWALKVESFVSALLPELHRLEQLTGGGPKAGAVGRRLDSRILVPGPTRREFESTMTALEACGTALAAAVPRAPTERLRPARATLVYGCEQLEQVSSVLRTDVLRAASPEDVSPDLLEDAAARADEGVRSIGGGFETLQRLLGAPPP